ncbi:hypothetical protein OQ486_16250, partial [Plesiomonas shigelloides]|uniref:zonular occludens toxin domain-containing protein n=1 Tax=Plesiomonas shigelloides TaxID=703 RepID=UPI002AFDD0E0
MAIVAYVGLPGHGKSYSVVAHVIIPAIKDNRRVITNIPLNADEIKADYPNADIRTFNTKDELLALGDLLVGAVVVVDECHKYWPAGLQAKAIPDNEKEFFGEHRHSVDVNGNSQQLVLITQDLRNLAAYSRTFIEQTYLCSKLIGVDRRKFKVYLHNGNITGTRPVESKILGSSSGTLYTYDPEIYKYYQSATKSQTGQVGNEEPLDNRARKGFILVVIKCGLIAFGIIVCLVLYASFFYTSDEPAKPEPKQVSSAPAPVPQQTKQQQVYQPPTPKITRPYENLKISLTGWMDNGRVVGGKKTQEFVLFFTLHDGTNRVMDITSSQLMMAGYKVRWRNDCLAELIFDDWREWAICDAPKVQQPDYPDYDRRESTIRNPQNTLTQ